MSDRIALYPLVKAYPVIDARTELLSNVVDEMA